MELRADLARALGEEAAQDIRRARVVASEKTRSVKLAFDRDKLSMGLKKACEKRPVSVEQVEAIVTEIERKLQDMGEKEVHSTLIGEEVMRRLPELDEVAYVRFASVYRSFRDIAEFMTELKDIIETQQSARAPKNKGQKG